MLVQMLHTISSALQIPVIVLLIVLTIGMVVIIGMLIAEVFTERRYFKLDLPVLIDDLGADEDPVEVIEDAELLLRQKQALLEVLRHPHAKEAQRESMAVSLVASEQNIYDNRTKITDFIAKVAPMLGLMGTLIPLGPGIVSIGSGDTTLLSESLLVAFDTTILGLIVGAVALLVSTIRKSWYVKYMAAFEAAMECVLEKANELAAAPKGAGVQAAVPQRTAAQSARIHHEVPQAPAPPSGRAEEAQREAPQAPAASSAVPSWMGRRDDDVTIPRGPVQEG